MTNQPSGAVCHVIGILLCIMNPSLPVYYLKELV